MSASAPLHVIVLAAGRGTRMRSRQPKVLQALAGKPLLAHCLERVAALRPDAVSVVVSHQQDRVREALADAPVTWVDQGRPAGTGHAVAVALDGVPDHARVLVTYGDVPRIPVGDLEACAAAASELAVLGAEVTDPAGYGRLIVDADGTLARIVEHADADATERAIQTINTGVLAGRAGSLRRWLAACEPPPEAGREWYLTDVVERAVADRTSVALIRSDCPDAVLGVNDRAQLAEQERLLQRDQALSLMRAGLALADPARFDLRGSLEHGQDCQIDVNVVLEGRVVLGDDVRVGPGCVLRDCTVGSRAEIAAHSVLEQANVAEDACIGPFARLRPGSQIGPNVRIGNFVEIKNAVLDAGAKVPHLSYVGDAHVGTGANLGAGTITCNYDGAHKHHTEIGAEAFVGSNTALVAPLSIGAGATVGAGSTLSQDVAPGALALTRPRARTIPDWPRPRKGDAPAEG
ncbi:MAG: bifunctional UDP-N-acetylglucosamine diphosphorylase/glucosamine-1-phosphate N-acetyltransferase GlmU [Pseudomonadota bacterium]